MERNYKIIAVDFDGTLCFSKWPDYGEPNQALINYLKKWKSDGWVSVITSLWSFSSKSEMILAIYS